ncbi:MAG: acetaldehyde dehydrogenase (acetylating) [Clostridiales bacterium]|jgi:acetaldehyde dehydrogenase (acetylating)|nr:acetaldehyde dehydrogenase (acetylating) [Clostridiales bacterium]
MLDYDLASVQEARNLARIASEAQKWLDEISQQEADRLVYALVQAADVNAKRLARMAVEETGFGIYQDKVIKNQFASRNVWSSVKDVKTVGVIYEDRDKKIVEIAVPVGVIMGLVPSTNPTSTVIYKAIISLKSRNAIIFSPHPSAAKCTFAAAQVMQEAAVNAGAPGGVIGCLSKVTMEATESLMRDQNVSLILATGGSGMVKAAYSVGKPALGVGPGNVPAFIERSADIKQSVANILRGKCFDNGTICASEQAVVTEECIKEQVMDEFRAQGGYFLSQKEVKQVCGFLFDDRGGMNAASVGKSPEVIAQQAGIEIPAGTKVLIGEQEGVGVAYPLSREKLTTVLAFYTEKDWHAACTRCIELLNEGGIGHTLVIHSQNEDVIREFALKKPVFRILVNTPSSLGGIGYTTGLVPALTLGSGTWGGSATSDNVSPLNLINRKRLAYHLENSMEQVSSSHGQAVLSVSNHELETIIKRVISRLA